MMNLKNSKYLVYTLISFIIFYYFNVIRCYKRKKNLSNEKLITLEFVSKENSLVEKNIYELIKNLKEQVENLFDKFNIIKFDELEKDALTGEGKMKHWHYFSVIAQKKSL